MPETIGTITEFITNPRKNNEVFGLKVAGEEYIYSFPDRRGEPFDLDKVQVGGLVRLEHSPFTGKDGKTKNYVNVLACTGAAPSTPQAAQTAPAAPEWGFEQKDKSIMAQTCLKAAAFMWVESLRAAVELYKLADTKPSAEEVSAYASAIMERKLPPIAELLKKWCLEAID